MPAETVEPAVLGSGELRPVDEHANLLTHGLGFVLSMPAAAVLMTVVVGICPAPLVAACGVYCVALVGLYAASTLSHVFHDPGRRRFFRMIDQAFIFLLISGSFTPIGVAYLGKGLWPALPALMWLIALFGVVFVLRVQNLTSAGRLIYLFLGWLPVCAAKALIDAAPHEVLAWLVASGGFYTLGTLFLRYDRIRYFHAVWHLFVIAGSICHYNALMRLVVLSS